VAAASAGQHGAGDDGTREHMSQTQQSDRRIVDHDASSTKVLGSVRCLSRRCGCLRRETACVVAHVTSSLSSSPCSSRSTVVSVYAPWYARDFSSWTTKCYRIQNREFPKSRAIWGLHGANVSATCRGHDVRDMTCGHANRGRSTRPAPCTRDERGSVSRISRNRQSRQH
jgi:hypothetical protein